MKFENDQYTGITLIKHKGYELEYPLNIIREGRSLKELVVGSSPFDILNQYIQTMSEEEQDQLFDFYMNCRILFDEVTDTQELSRKIKFEIQKLCQIVTVEKMNYWTKFRANVHVPHDLMNDFDEMQDKSLVTRERTYVKEDYLDLLGWLLCLRFLLPVWSVFVDKTKNVHGTTWKVYHAYYLIAGTPYHDCAACQRLEKYVEATIPDDTNLNSAIMNGISRFDFPRWLISLTVIRRIVVYNLEGGPETPSLIKVIYKFIASKAGQSDKQFGGIVRIRETNKSNNISDNNTTSAFEGYNSRQSLADDDLVIIEHYLKDPYRVAKDLDSTIPDEVIRQACENIDMLYDNYIDVPQVILTKWAVNRVIPARALDYVNRRYLINAMIAARSWYWHIGLKDLALLSSAIQISNEDEHQITGTSNRARLVRDIQERLGEKYPHYRKTVTRKASNDVVLGIKLSIEHVERLLSRNEWHLTVCKEWINEKGLISKHFSVPEDLKLTLVELALILADRPQLRSPY